VTFAMAGLVAGRAADLHNRRTIVTLAGLGWSLFVCVQALSSSFPALLVARLGMGLAHAFSGPASLSMVADLFAPEHRGRANGIYTFGIYLGGGLSSLSLAMAGALGWRTASWIIAAVGFASVAAFYALVSEPRHQAYLFDSAAVHSGHGQAGDEQGEALLPDARSSGAQAQAQAQAQAPGGYQATATAAAAVAQRGAPAQAAQPAPPKKASVTYAQALSLAWREPSVRLLFLAAPTRFLGGFAIGTFLPQYYRARFPDEVNTVYSTLNALIVSGGGLAAAYSGGLITDRLRKSTPSAAAIVPALGSLLALLPFFGVMYADNFYASLACLLLEYLLAEGWFGPALSIMQERVPAEARGVTISIYLFISGIVGSLSPALLGHLDTGVGYEGLQRNILIFVCVSYGGTFVLFCAIYYALKTPYTPLQQQPSAA
jgi:MFS family permease